MKNIELKINVQYLQLDELPQDEQELVAAAIKATDNSNAKYSHFRVGAALLLTDGSVVIGANQENAAFPSGLCAERVTVFYANAKYPDVAVDTLLITVLDENGDYRGEPVPPCGACRQVLSETETRQGKPMRILLVGKSKVYEFSSVSDLLPFIFSGNELL